MFRHDMEARLGKKHPVDGPPPNVLAALVRQGAILIQLCWRTFPIEVSIETRRKLANEDVADHEMQLWTARLSMPFLSRPEILTLKAHTEEADKWSEREKRRGRPETGRPTPKRLTIWVLAHRLQIPAHRIARKFVGRAESEHFKMPNPIEAFLPFP